MSRGAIFTATAWGALALAAPLSAQNVAPAVDSAPAAPAPVAVSLALPAAPAALAPNPVDAFYAARAEAPIWLRDEASRAAAAKLPAILRDAMLEDFTNGPELAANVEAAIARGGPSDDKIISAAWLRYVQALKAPVKGVSFGDPALQPKMPTADTVLGEAARAPSLAVYVDQVSAVNSFYSAIHQAAVKQGRTTDPHVRATLDRLRLVPASGRAILVDVANAEMMMLQDGQVVDSMKVIVGKKNAATPLLAGTIHYVTLNPYWHIPQDVAKRVVAPLVLKRGVAYLKAAKYETVAAFGGDKEQPIDPESVDWKAVAAGDIEANIRQLSGPNNMMGKMKFGFANDFGIFLHDTPHKNLFAKAKRNLSLGCIRLEHPERLAQWLLGREPDLSGDGSEENVRIDAGVPIYVSYLTARTDSDQQLAFADDVYSLDAAPTALASSRPAKPPAEASDIAPEPAKASDEPAATAIDAAPVATASASATH